MKKTRYLLFQGIMALMLVMLLNSGCGKIDALAVVEDPNCESNEFTKHMKVKSVWMDEYTDRTVIEIEALDNFELTTTFYDTDYICDSDNPSAQFQLKAVSGEKKCDLGVLYKLPWNKGDCFRFEFPLIPADIKSIDFMLSYVQIKNIQLK